MLTAVAVVVEEMTVCCCLATARFLTLSTFILIMTDNYLISVKYPTNTQS